MSYVCIPFSKFHYLQVNDCIESNLYQEKTSVAHFKKAQDYMYNENISNFCGSKRPTIQDAFGSNLFSLYLFFSHFTPRNVPKEIFLLFLHALCINMHVQKTTLKDTVP